MTKIDIPEETLRKLKEFAQSRKNDNSWILSENRIGIPIADKLNEISGWYRSERLVLVLGAGTSASYGLPDWSTLLQKLLLITINSGDDSPKSAKNNKEKDSIVAKTFTGVFEPSPLISARYLHNYFDHKHPSGTIVFEKAIREVLYENLDSIHKESDLLKEIRQFCIAPGRSPNLDSIITYNYDDLLEQCLQNIDVEIPFIPIHYRGMNNDNHELPIYHVHGYLPHVGQLTYKNRVVLSEDGYHKQYTNLYGWSNLIQINKFKDYNCLFIGLSFSDPNLRRLLDISKNERGDKKIHHYCIKKRHNLQSVKQRLEKLLFENEDIVKEKVNKEIELNNISAELINLMEKFEENDAISFGVDILWVNTYEEIPGLLKRIREEHEIYNN